MPDENENLQLNQEQEEEEIEESKIEVRAEPQITLIELMLWPLPAAILSDIVDIFDWTGIGTVLAWALGILSGGSLTLWLFMKGLRGEFMLLGSLIDMIPFVGVFPTKTVILIFIYLKQRHPKVLSGKVAKGLEIAGAATGQVELEAAGKALKSANQLSNNSNKQSE